MSLIREISRDLYLLEGTSTRLLRLPMPDRSVIVDLGGGALWIYGPVALTEEITEAVNALGQPVHLVIPNRRGIAALDQWHAVWPESVVWASQPCLDHAQAMDCTTAGWQVLGEHGPWPGLCAHYLVAHSWGGAESVFLHHDSGSLILGDLIVNLETAQMPLWARPFVWLMGIDDSDGKMPPRWGRRDKDGLLADVEHLLSWEPQRILLRHGRCYLAQGSKELNRAFRRLLRDRDWDRALAQIKRQQGRIDPR